MLPADSMAQPEPALKGLQLELLQDETRGLAMFFFFLALYGQDVVVDGYQNLIALKTWNHQFQLE